MHKMRGLLSGLITVLILCYGFHAIGIVGPTKSGHYFYSNYFYDCISLPFALSYFTLALILGFAIRQAKWIAWGMILSLPVAVQLDLNIDPSDHNLLGIEAVIYWLPAFILAYIGAYLGSIIAKNLTETRRL